MKYAPRRRRIPISAARTIAVAYGYDQVVIYARGCDVCANCGALGTLDEIKARAPNPETVLSCCPERKVIEGGEHMTTYGVTRAHCAIAARIGDTLKRFMGWNVTPWPNRQKSEKA